MWDLYTERDRKRGRGKEREAIDIEHGHTDMGGLHTHNRNESAVKQERED